mgnify:CR=1 FL=1
MITVRQSVHSGHSTRSEVSSVRLCRNQCARVWISEGKGYVSVAENLDLLAYTTEEAGGFVGCTVGVYASSNGSDSTNYADFEWLTCQSMD